MDLQTFFEQHPQTALAFSGGCDSAYLLYEAMRHGKRVKAYYVRSQFQPAFELELARRIAQKLQADLQIIDTDVLSDPKIAANPADRCYWCKRRIFESIQSAAKADGFTVLLDGTNASDDASDRPGMKALQEMQVLSPLRLCGLDKEEIRRRSCQAGLETWDLPAYACLATRMPAGTPIRKEDLARTEWAEERLKDMGFSDFRVRTFHNAARIQVVGEQLEMVLQKRQEIVEALKSRYEAVLLDLEVRDEK